MYVKKGCSWEKKNIYFENPSVAASDLEHEVDNLRLLVCLSLTSFLVSVRR